MSHHSFAQYRLPATGELIPLLQIAPSKTDTERLLVIAPELADVLSAIICRIRRDDGAVPLVVAYDIHERVWNPPMPLLFQRQIGVEHRPIPIHGIRKLLNAALAGTGLTDASGKPLNFTPHDFRRLFITDAVHERHAAAHRPARGRARRHQRHDGIQGGLPRGSHQRPPGVHRPPPRHPARRGIPHSQRRRMGRVPRPLRAAQGRSRRLRTGLRNQLRA